MVFPAALLSEQQTQTKNHPWQRRASQKKGNPLLQRTKLRAFSAPKQHSLRGYLEALQLL